MSYANPSSPPPADYVLLKSTNGSSETYFICGLLESHSIKVHVDTDILPFTNDMPAAIAKTDIYVKASDLIEAQELLRTAETSEDDLEFRNYKENRNRKGIFWGRLLGLLFTGLLLGIANLPMKESDKEIKYVLIGGALFFFLLFVIPLLFRGKNN